MNKKDPVLPHGNCYFTELHSAPTVCCSLVSCYIRKESATLSVICDFSIHLATREFREGQSREQSAVMKLMVSVHTTCDLFANFLRFYLCRTFVRPGQLGLGFQYEFVRETMAFVIIKIVFSKERRLLRELLGASSNHPRNLLSANKAIIQPCPNLFHAHEKQNLITFSRARSSKSNTS